jgi:hypothetical protein
LTMTPPSLSIRSNAGWTGLRSSASIVTSGT